LTVEERTPLARWISRGATSAPNDERYAEEYLLAHVRLAAYGYHFYEVSNAARDGHRSRHNSAYWSGRAYLGLGPAAHSFDGRVRRWNLPAWEAYRRAVAARPPVVEAVAVLTDEQRELERQVLEAVIETYVETAEPAGSRTISKRFGHTLSAATIRNTMSDLEEKGYLYHPHTSAGRIPTDLAYRVYVNSLMRLSQVSASD